MFFQRVSFQHRSRVPHAELCRCKVDYIGVTGTCHKRPSDACNSDLREIQSNGPSSAGTWAEGFPRSSSGPRPRSRTTHSGCDAGQVRSQPTPDLTGVPALRVFGLCPGFWIFSGRIQRGVYAKLLQPFILSRSKIGAYGLRPSSRSLL